MNVRRNSLLSGAEQAQGLPIIIDVLRAFTTSAVLFSLGIESLILVSTAEESFALREKYGCWLAGEDKGIKIEGFDSGNSPTELLRLPPDSLRGKTVVLRSSAGTQGVVAALKNVNRVILGSYVMAKSIATYVRQQNPELVTIVGMGQRLLETAPEDEACADYLEHLLSDIPYDHFNTLWTCMNTPFIQRCLHSEVHYVVPEDILLCLQRDLFDFVLVAEKVDGLIRVTKVNTKIETRPLTNDQWQRLLNFKGYGRLTAPIWFIGMEEGIGDIDEEILANISARVDLFHSDTMDMVEAHHAMNYYIDKLEASPTQVWTWMAKIVQALSNEQQLSNLEYIKTRLGRSEGCSFLTELLPLPTPNNNAWPSLYSLLTSYQNREEYEDAILEHRKAMLNDLVTQYTPRYIFAYGKRYHAHYKDLFADVKFSDKHVPPFLIGQRGETTIILSPFFGVGALSTANLDALINYLAHQSSGKIDCTPR